MLLYKYVSTRCSVEQNLPWKGSTDDICKKVTVGISAIRRIKPFVDQDTLVLIHTAIVRPHFDCCSEVWDVFGETQSKRLPKLQNRAGKTYYCSAYFGLGATSSGKGKKPKQKLCTSY